MTVRAGLFEAVDEAGVRTFGDQVTITYHNLAPQTVDGVFEAPGERIAVLDGLPIASSTPGVGLHIPSLSRLPETGDTITRAGIVYQVGEVVPDGQAGVFVELVRPMPAAI
jgi:hypothetical protein